MYVFSYIVRTYIFFAAAKTKTQTKTETKSRVATLNATGNGVSTYDGLPAASPRVGYNGDGSGNGNGPMRIAGESFFRYILLEQGKKKQQQNVGSEDPLIEGSDIDKCMRQTQCGSSADVPTHGPIRQTNLFANLYIKA